MSFDRRMSFFINPSNYRPYQRFNVMFLIWSVREKIRYKIKNKKIILKDNSNYNNVLILIVCSCEFHYFPVNAMLDYYYFWKEVSLILFMAREIKNKSEKVWVTV